jgi:diaminohydroxyphosphoribosylaminopyrimidine deaminase/5-amino-6-(5-phosphoribosylamino)uracil reductase
MDQLYMQRCLELARLGSGNVAPNPLVGSVIVFNNQIIGEGWHQKVGFSHAEVNAIASVSEVNKPLIKLATLYVNLEPCAHFGKTPPCVDLIIASGIPKVVIGMLDPNPLVAGKGIEKLRNAGIEVIIDVLKDECHLLNKRFIKGITLKKPYVILKWAQTANGFLSPDASKITKEEFEQQRHITGKLVQKLVHKWRTQEDAIMVGTNTALTDNPALNNRAWEGRSPARVVLDKSLRLPSTLKIFDGSQKTFVLNASLNKETENLVYLKLNFEEDWFSEALQKLYIQGVSSLVVEGGAQLLNHILSNGLWDEAIIFYSKSHLADGIKAPNIRGKLFFQEDLGQVALSQYLNQ